MKVTYHEARGVQYASHLGADPDEGVQTCGGGCPHAALIFSQVLSLLAAGVTSCVSTWFIKMWLMSMEYCNLGVMHLKRSIDEKVM